MPLVSIIIPVYNTQKYLDECIKSVTNQTLQDIEIIFVDDGSNDKSPEIIESYAQKDSRIAFLKQNHKKQGAARNLGMKYAKGKYIGFVDSDDRIEPDMFEKLYNRAEETQSDITMCQVIMYDDVKKTFEKNNPHGSLGIFNDRFFKDVFTPKDTYDFVFGIPVYPYNKIYRRDFLEKNNLKFPVNIYYEDSVFFLDSWLRAERLSLIKEPLYYYRLFSDSSTCFSNDIHKLDGLKTIKPRVKILKETGLYKELKKDFAKYKKFILLYWFNQIKDRRVKIIYSVLMFINTPSCLTEPVCSFKRDFLFRLRLRFSGKKRIVLWGASLFLEKFINKYKIKNENIIGIIDKNPEREGAQIGNYQIYSPEKIKELNPDEIIITIVNFSEQNRENIRQYLNDNGYRGVSVKLIK